MILQIDIDKYPLFKNSDDPEGMIHTILAREHAIFSAQCSSTANVELLKVVSETCEHLQEEFSQREEERTSAIHRVLDTIPVLLAKSVTKGDIAEKCVIDYLRDNLCATEYSVEDTSKIPNSADVLVTKKSFACMIDSKNYNRKVPKKEVDKLKRDMIANTTRCGILVNFGSGIAGYKNIDIDFFEENGETYCIAILGHLTDSPFKMIMAIQYLEAIYDKLNESKQSFVLIVDDYSDILDSTTELTELLTKFDKHKRIIDESLCDYYKHLITTITSHISNLKCRLKKR